MSLAAGERKKKMVQIECRWVECSDAYSCVAHTFDPESFDAGLQGGRLQSDCAQRQQENSEEQDLAGVRLYEAAEAKQAPLQMPAYPQCPPTTGRLALLAITTIV